MTARDRTLILVDIFFAVLALVVGTMALTSIVRFTITSISIGTLAPWTLTWAGTLIIMLLVTAFAYRKIDNIPLRVLVVILLFVPQIYSLLMQQTIPFPDIGFI